MGIQINGQTDTVTSTTSGGTVKITPASIVVTGVSTFSDIRITGGTIAGVSTAGITTAYIGSVNDGPISGARNRIINGDMRIDQRNAGASFTATTGNLYTLDRWRAMAGQASKYSVQQNAGSVATPAGFNNYLGVTSLAATTLGAADYFWINQTIEAFNTADFNWGTVNAQTVTASFWVRSSLTGTFSGGLTNSDGAVVASSRCYPFTYTISSANTWEYKTVTVAGDTSGTWEGATNSRGIAIIFNLGAGSNFTATAGAWTGTANNFVASGGTSVVGTSGATFYITGVQLEPGTVATPFERRSYGQELALCQRYYQESSSVVTNVSIYTNHLRLPVSMRASPSIGTITFDSGTGATFANVSTQAQSLYQATNHSTTGTATKIPLSSEL